MQPLDLNLASNPFRNNTLLWIGYVGAFVLLSLFTVWNVKTYRDHDRLLAELRDEVGTFDSQRQELERRALRARKAIEQFDVEALRRQADKANEVINWKAFSWTRLFNQLERIQPNDVRMNTVRPIFRGQRRGLAAEAADETSMPVAIEGTARTFSDFADLEHSLQNDPHFGRVEPERVHRAENGEIVFQLKFLYNPLAEATTVAASGAAANGATADAGSSAPGAAAPASPTDAGRGEPTEVIEAWPAASPAEGQAVQSAGGSR